MQWTRRRCQFEGVHCEGLLDCGLLGIGNILYGQRTLTSPKDMLAASSAFKYYVYIKAKLSVLCTFLYLLTYSMEQSPSWEANKFSSHSRNSPHCMEPESSLPQSQVPATCPSPELSPLTFKNGEKPFLQTVDIHLQRCTLSNPDDNSLKHLSNF